MPTSQELQAAIDWNISRRDEHRLAGQRLALTMPITANAHERDAKRYQRNITALNAQLNGGSNG